MATVQVLNGEFINDFGKLIKLKVPLRELT